MLTSLDQVIILVVENWRWRIYALQQNCT